MLSCSALINAGVVPQHPPTTDAPLSIRTSGLITAVGGEGILRCRLLDMGLIPNTRVTVQKIAPMGDPMEIRLRSYELTLRMDDAAQIEILPEVGA